MNPWVILATVLLWGASVGGSYWYGTAVGTAIEIAKQDAVKDARIETREQARLGAADEIAKIKVRNTTLQAKVETITRDVPVYRDCRHDPDAFRLLNESITGKPSGPGVNQGNVPGADSP